ncbi:hypothetical protein GGI12_003932 [Dipsacomyces acuminosporus]|nr:hypothetical protein GGI12_003932 [Dipsacomyces acuminosporus]
MDAISLLSKREPRMTDEERLKAAADRNIYLDPIGTSDTINIIVSFSVYGITALLLVVAWIHRNYRPIRSKNLFNITMMLICGILWNVGSLLTNGLVPSVGVWSHCKFWTIWFRLMFHYWYFFLLIFRMHALHRIFILNKPCSGWVYYIPVMVMAVFTLVFNLTAQLLPAEKVIKYNPALELCNYADAFKQTCLYVTVAFTVIHAVYVILIRKIKSSFNEFREALVVYATGTFMILVIIVMHIIVPRYPLYRYVRIASATADTIFIISPMWLFLARPVYMCLFNHDEYLATWLQKLSDDGLSKRYKMQEGKEGASTTAYSNMEDDSRRLKDTEYNHGTVYMDEMNVIDGYTQQGPVQQEFGYAQQGPIQHEFAYSSPEQAYGQHRSLETNTHTRVSFIEPGETSPRRLV